MKISILTTVSNPEQRQDKWREAIECYKDFADEVVIVNGSEQLPEHPYTKYWSEKVKVVDMFWPEEWNWIELPLHLNFGLQHCTGDWILKLDIDQLIHERNFKELREIISKIPQEYDSATMQKATFTYDNKWFQKGETENLFRNRPYIKFGSNRDIRTDLCFPIHEKGTELVYPDNSTEVFEIPWGSSLKRYKTGIKFWNYDYFFKDQAFTKKEFWRFSKAYNRYFKNWAFGSSEEKAFQVFLESKKNRYETAPYKANLGEHPQYIREAVRNLTPEQFGHSAWGLYERK